MSFDDAHEIAAEHHDSHEQPAQGATNTAPQGQQGQQGQDSAQKASGDRAQGGDQDEGKPRSKRPLIIIAIVVAILAVAGFIAWFVTRNQESTDDAYTDGNAVSIVPKVSGYVTQLLVDDNSRVKKGDLLVRIDQRDYLTAQAQATAQLSLAEAQLSSAKDSLRIAQVQYPAQLEAARAQQQSASAALALADATYARQHQVDRRATTQENIDTSTSQQQSSLATLRSAKAQVAIAGLVDEQVRQAQNVVAERDAAVKQAQAQLLQADLNVGYTEIRAPSDGFVTLRNVQLGSFLTAGQVMFVLVTPEVWITANFKESQIGRMRPGDKVDVKVDAYSGYKLHGHVQSIQAGSGSRFSAFPAENATGNFVKIVQRVPVKITIDSGLDANAVLPLGLSVKPVVYFQ
jgi:membrane fusion protein (multidrug efflux system)